MSNEALTAAPSVKTKRMIDKFVLVVLEASALDVFPVSSVEDIAEVTGSSVRTIKEALRRLEDDGIISVERGVPTVVEFAGHFVRLDTYAGVMHDDPWQVLRAKVFAEKGASCYYCGKDASHVDHKIPRSRGGADAIDNLVPSCRACNTLKGRKTADEFMGES